MTDPLFHPKTKLLVDSYLELQPHSLLIAAPKGSGKLHRALWLAEQTGLAPIHVRVQDDKKLIGIEQIQQLYTQTRSGNPSMVVIENAEQMSADAQNALLKLLEEPPRDTHFVLTAHSLESVLPTIRSRCQIISLIQPSNEDLSRHISLTNSSLSEAETAALMATTQGLIGTLMSVIASNDTSEQHASSVSEAKKFYSGTAYERLTLAQVHGLDRDWSLRLLELLSVIISALINTSGNDPTRLKKLERQISEIERATTALKQAGNPKIHISRLALAL